MTTKSRVGSALTIFALRRRGAVRSALMLVLMALSLTSMAQQQVTSCGQNVPGSPACPVPASSGWTLTTLSSLLAAAGLFLLRRRRRT